MTKKTKVAVATYTNTLPFLRGLEQANIQEYADLMMDYPSACADLVISGKADIGIIPIRALLDIPNYEIVGDYCIGSDGAVDSVFIFSHVPIEEVRTFRLDHQSKTSNGLAKILLKHYWKREVDIVADETADAFVLIGDRTFGQKKNYPYHYDMGYYWKELTRLPFAFAVWAANKPLSTDFKQRFNEALSQGVGQIDKVIAELPIRSDFNFTDYLTNKLDFLLTDEKRKAIALYLELYSQL